MSCRYRSEHRVGDQRAAYSSKKYPWILQVSAFVIVSPTPHDVGFDTALIKLPRSLPAGEYIAHYRWSGYNDCVDIAVLPPKPSGAPAITGEINDFARFGYNNVTSHAEVWSRVDHCQYLRRTLDLIDRDATTMKACEDATVCQRGGGMGYAPSIGMPNNEDARSWKASYFVDSNEDCADRCAAQTSPKCEFYTVRNDITAYQVRFLSQTGRRALSRLRLTFTRLSLLASHPSLLTSHVPLHPTSHF